MAWLALVLLVGTTAGASHAQMVTGGPTQVYLDPITRYFHITYLVPADAPEVVTVRCLWSPRGREDWQPAVVIPLIGETTLRLTPETEIKRWVYEGTITERRAAGLERTVVFNPYPEAEVEGRVDVDFRVLVLDAEGAELARHDYHLQADNSDVVCIEDWTQVLQRGALADDPKPEDRKWRFRTDLDPKVYSRGDALFGASPPDTPLPQLTYPLDLKGTYAIFVRNLAHGHALHMRLSGDERADQVYSLYPRWEMFWRWARMDRQHLVLRQSHYYTGYVGAHIDYVRLVPLSPELVARLEATFAGQRDKLVAGYFEPYSWAFQENVQQTLHHREPLTAFAEARVDLVDIQVGRFGDKVVYESRETDPLIYGTFGDPIGRVTPQTDNVGYMQQYTNTLDAELRYARELGMVAHANFGGSNCYPGTPLESDFSRQHPEWRRGSCLRYEVPEVREYILRLCREALEIGAPGISIDFCRYPEGIDSAQTCTSFLRELRALTEEFAHQRGVPVPILIRFPATGVRLWEHFDYRTWVAEGLVDYLCPSNIQARHLSFDITPYVEAVRGSRVKLLPVVDGLHWGLPMPGAYLWRVRELYRAGVDGIYVYQADARVLGWPEDRRTIALLGSSEAVERWWQAEQAARPRRSKSITITAPHHLDTYKAYERVRIWTEGIEMGELEVYLDDNLVSRFDGPPYLVGTEEYASDTVIPAGEHVLRVRARDGDGWLEQTFQIKGG